MTDSRRNGSLPAVRPRALVFGGRGMVGRAVAAQWRRHGAAVLALSSGQADVTDAEAVADWARRFDPEVVINCAAFTRVDDCEEEVDQAMAVNGDAVGNLARAAESVGAALLHVSTDYVFDGEAEAPIDEDTPTAPQSVYGRSKLLGEEQALDHARTTVLRTSWLFGPPGPNFPQTMARLLRAGHGRPEKPLRVVDDQRGRPTYTPYVARALWDLARLHAATARRDVPRIVHYGNREPVTWYGFTRELVRLLAPDADLDASVLPVTTDEFPRPAPRPAYSVLDVSRFEALAGRAVESWAAGLAEYVDTHLSPL